MDKLTEDDKVFLKLSSRIKKRVVPIIEMLQDKESFINNVLDKINNEEDSKIYAVDLIKLKDVIKIDYEKLDILKGILQSMNNIDSTLNSDLFNEYENLVNKNEKNVD